MNYTDKTDYEKRQIHNSYQRAYYQKNKEKLRKYRRDRYRSITEDPRKNIVLKAQSKTYRDKCKDRSSEYQKIYKVKNKERLEAYSKKYRENNKILIAYAKKMMKKEEEEKKKRA